MTSVTSALLRIGRVPAPPKMTSSMPEPRMEVGRFSPITQRIASKRLDLPQPLGPTTPDSPGWIKSSVGSKKDLNPLSLRRENFNVYPVLPLGGLFADQRVQNLLQVVVGNFTRMRRSVDDESRRRVDVVPSLPLLPIAIYEFEVLRTVGAGRHFFSRHARLARHLGQAFYDVLLGDLLVAVEILDPVHLIREQKINERKILLAGKTARYGRCHPSRSIERIFAEHEFHLAGVDVVLLELRNDLRLEGGAVGTGHGRIFDDGHRCVGLAVDHIGRLDLHGLAAAEAGGQGARIATGKQKRERARGQSGNEFPVHEPAPNESPGHGFGRGRLLVQSARLGRLPLRDRASLESASESGRLALEVRGSSALRVGLRPG